MNRTEPLRPCPYCGSEMRAGSLSRHTPLCIANPAAFARYRVVLASDARHGITCNQYVALSSADKTLPTVITLRRLAGVKKWDAVLAKFGLLPPPKDQLRNQCPHCGKLVSGPQLAAHQEECRQRRAAPKPPPSPRLQKIYTFKPKAERKPRTVPAAQPCPQCGKPCINMHRHVCPEDPAVVAWLQQVLPDPADPRYIISSKVFRTLPNKRISEAVLTRHTTWAALAARYGLKISAPPRNDDGTPQLYPAELRELHRLAQELHDGRIGPSHGEFGIYAKDTPRKETGLAKVFGGWAAVLAAAGLPVGTMSDYMQAAHIRRQAHEATRVQQRVASKYERGDEPISREPVGLPVASVRRLPNGGTAMMIR